MDLITLLEVFRRRKWIIVQAVLIVTLVAFIGTHFITPSYQASSKILIKQAKKGGIDTGTIGLSGLPSIITTSTDLDVNKVLAASRPYIEKLVFTLQLRDEEGTLINADNLTQLGPMSAIKERIFPKPRISISQYQGTDVLQLKAISPDPEEAMMMANTLAEIMVDQNQTQMRAEYKNARIFLEDQMDKVKKRYNTALLKLTDFKKQEETIDLKTETRLAAEKMMELLKQKEDNIIDLAEARAKLNRLKEQLAIQSPEFLPASTLQESPQIEILSRRLTGLRLQLTEAAAELMESHPQVLSLREQVKMAEGELKKEIEVYRSSAPELSGLQRQIAALEAHLKGVNVDINKYFTAVSGLPDKALKQASLDMELNVTQQAYSSLLDSLYQVGMGEATTLSEIRVIEPAVKPFSPASPNKALNGLMGIFLGLVFGIGLAFVLEYLDDTIRTAEDVKQFKPIALLGAIPRQEKMRLISTVDPNDPLYEAYRKIRTHLTVIDHMRERPLKSLLITSALPEEGKSTTVANLAISACLKGKKVAIVDMDLRRPVIHTYFDIPNEVGTSDVLKNTTRIDDAINLSQIEGLSVIPSGPPLIDPAGVIESDKMGLFISGLRDRFDLVIVDSAPLLVKSDALVLAEHVDGSIIILESGKTTPHAVHELLEMLARANIEPLGFVLNKFTIEKGKYYYHQYYYGRYGRKFAGETG